MDSNLKEIDSIYEESLQYLFSRLPMFSRVGAPAYKPGLDTSIALDNMFGNPHRKFKSIHIAGTNGKGSTSHLIASILQAQGYKTALYTSPHLVDFRERMRINGEMIPKEKVIEFTDKWRNSNTGLTPSFFELTMMMAFQWFAEEEVDYAVIEVGMGGRLDSTNIITPELSVITNISFDHTQFLGSTLPQIAMEKAGIMKKGITTVIGEAEGDVEKVFEDKADETGAGIVKAYTSPLLANAEKDPLKGWNCMSAEGQDFYCALSGDYQLKNINTVLHAVEGMRKAGIDISKEAVVKGFADVEKSTGFAGRWTVLNYEPYIVCDTGHNEGGLRYNMRQLQELREKRPGSTLRMVVGFVSDKAVVDILDLFPRDAVYYITQASVPRAMKVEELAGHFKDAGIPATSYPDVPSAYKAALADSTSSDIIYIGGSTFIVADFLANHN